MQRGIMQAIQRMCQLLPAEKLLSLGKAVCSCDVCRLSAASLEIESGREKERERK